MEVDEQVYLRYYVGHKGKFGHELLQFEIKPDGQLIYSNNSNYRNEGAIERRCRLAPIVMNYIKHKVLDSCILAQTDERWPMPDQVGRQELDVILGARRASFCTTKIGSYAAVTRSDDPKGLEAFYYLTQDLKALVLELVSINFKVQPI